MYFLNESMNHENNHWFYEKIIPERICDEIIRFFKAQRKHIETQSMEELLDPAYTELPSNKIQQALGIEDDSFEYFETLELIENSHLSPKEEQFILLRLEGLTMEEITEDLHESAYTIRAGLRDKVQALFNKGEEVNDYGKEGEVYRRI